jgi:Translationally controlled tumour protein
VKAVNNKLKETGASEETIKEFQGGAAAAVKKILGNYDNYDVLMGQSMDGNAMHVLIDFRDDGVTPFATVWKHGLKEIKV